MNVKIHPIIYFDHIKTIIHAAITRYVLNTARPIKFIGNRLFPTLMYSNLDDYLLNHLYIPQHNVQKPGASVHLGYIRNKWR